MPISPKATAQQAATEVVRRLQEHGHEAYFAGGCVRDQIMGLTPQDYDIATSAKPSEVLTLFPRSRKVGAAFGVILVRQAGFTMEVATFRCDGPYADGRHPAQVTFATARQDARRRDFTCNGLFFDPIAQRLIDYVDGRRDIEQKLLRAIGDAAERFQEDHLRMIRAVRFAARLGFTIAPPTWEAIRASAEKIASVSRERIGEEMRMLLTAAARQRGVELLRDSGLLEHFWPAPIVPPGGMKGWLGRLPATCGFTAALAAMWLDLETETTPAASPGRPQPPPTVAGLRLPPASYGQRLQKALALSGREREDLVWLVEKLPVLRQWSSLPTAQLKRLLADPRCGELRRLYQAQPLEESDSAALESRLNELARGPVAPPPLVTGADLIRLGATPGPRFKRWLDELYDRQLEEEFADADAALRAAQKLIEPH